jgi:hypothetical protein
MKQKEDNSERFRPFTEYVDYTTTIIDDDAIGGVAIYKVDDRKAFLNERLCSYAYLNHMIDILAGRSLTLIESIITDPRQQRAAKDTLKALVADQRDKVYGIVYRGE